MACRRLFAYWLDFLILAACFVIPQSLISFMTSGFPFSKLDTGFKIELWILLTISLPVWTYFIVGELLYRQTLGKRMLALAVISDAGSRIRLKQAFLRTLIKLLPWELTHLIILIPEPWWSVEEPGNVYLIYIPNLIMLLFIVILFRNKGVKGLHDVLSRTRVVEAGERGAG